jgi:uncharacterized Zn finger protein (UPF0148 family)
MSDKMERCPQCKKILFKKKNGSLACPNGCEQSSHRVALNTVVDPLNDRRSQAERDPWRFVK